MPGWSRNAEAKRKRDDGGCSLSCQWMILVLATRLRNYAPRIASMTTLLILFILILAAVVVAWLPWDSRVFNDPVESRIQSEYRKYSQGANTYAFAVVTLSVRRLDPGEFTASTVVSVRFIGSALTNRQGKSIFSETAAFGSVRATGSAHGDGAISVRIATEFGAVRFSIPVAEFDPVTTSAKATVSIPMRGQPQYFPQDYYQFQAVSFVQLPADVFVLPAGQSTPVKPVQTLTAFKVGSGLAYWRARLLSNQSPEVAGQQGQDQGSMELYRPAKFYLYVYAVVSSPVLLVLVYFMMSIASGKARGATSHFEFAVAILAIFTLREVFVPNGIASLTRLDHLLGLAVIGCILIAAFISLVEYQTAPRKNADPTPGSTSSSAATLAAERRMRRRIDALIILALLILGRRASIHRVRGRRRLM
jgi:hypothetical protein